MGGGSNRCEIPPERENLATDDAFKWTVRLNRPSVNFRPLECLL
jgi:hypothetical protein